MSTRKSAIKNKIFKIYDKNLALCTIAEMDALATIIYEKRPETVIELGCMYGISSAYMAEAMNNYGTIYCIDCFVVQGSDTEEHFKRKVLPKYKNMRLIRDYAHIASMAFHKKIDFLFIDADHQDHSIQEDIRDWLPKLNKNGIVAFHDYNNYMFPSVKNRVDELTKDLETINEIDSIIIKQKRG